MLLGKALFVRIVPYVFLGGIHGGLTGISICNLSKFSIMKTLIFKRYSRNKLEQNYVLNVIQTCSTVWQLIQYIGMYVKGNKNYWYLLERSMHYIGHRFPKMCHITVRQSQARRTCSSAVSVYSGCLLQISVCCCSAFVFGFIMNSLINQHHLVWHVWIFLGPVFDFSRFYDICYMLG